jgi:CRISPR-associated exonuclease Cas4
VLLGPAPMDPEGRSAESAAEPVPISALEHWSYCRRQCALIHVEQTFDENLYTLRGKSVHETVDEVHARAEGTVRVEYALPLWSELLGLVGKADAVEFLPAGTPYPVEHKCGRRARFGHAELQLCAQAMCLEEMVGLPVPKGAIFHFSSRRRQEVDLDGALRQQVHAAIDGVRALLGADALPPPRNDARCPRCSLVESCMPSVVADPRKVHRMARSLFEAEAD